jgi:enoyl-CoA hydratase
MREYQYLTTESYDDGAIVKILLNRPETRNAQNPGLLYELEEAFVAAETDDRVRVVILGGVGPSFSSGHDMGTKEALADRDERAHRAPELGEGATLPGREAPMRYEWHHFLQNTLRWRNLRKITVAAVQGKCYAGGLMLAWACDLIVAAEDVEFADVVGTRLGMCGLEYFGHPWEFGPRKAKELLLTGDSIGAQEAHQLGMVSKIFPNDRFEEDTLAFARRIAKLPSFTALMIKESVNQTVDNMGFYNSLQACFTIHTLNHSHWGELTAREAATGEPAGMPNWRAAGPVLPAQVGAP